jgi:hypothetical protein
VSPLFLPNLISWLSHRQAAFTNTLFLFLVLLLLLLLLLPPRNRVVEGTAESWLAKTMTVRCRTKGEIKSERITNAGYARKPSTSVAHMPSTTLDREKRDEADASRTVVPRELHRLTDCRLTRYLAKW